jgi:hypothetical protein
MGEVALDTALKERRENTQLAKTAKSGHAKNLRAVRNPAGEPPARNVH